VRSAPTVIGAPLAPARAFSPGAPVIVVTSKAPEGLV
jgi:hypothetical protein